MNKTQKRSSLMIRLVMVLAVVMMFTMCFVGGTFAKYTSTGTGTDSTRVAKWSFTVGGTDIAKENTFTFNLFDTIKDTDGANEEDVTPADGTIIAPGTSGSFDIVLKNESQVTAQYAIDYTVTNTSNIPVKFSVDGGTTWTNDLADVVASDLTKLTTVDGSTPTKTITVQWKWLYESGDDDFDTNLGTAETLATLTVSAKVTATQVD